MVVCEVRPEKTILIIPASLLVAVASVSQGMLAPTPHPSNSSRCSSTVCSLTKVRASAPLTSRTSTLIPQCPILNMSASKSQTSQPNSLRNTSLQVQTATVGSSLKFAKADMVFPKPAFWPMISYHPAFLLKATMKLNPPLVSGTTNGVPSNSASS